eukprot:scaffold50014_cov25-Tisochrysis_lutea.AAC.4
MHPVQHCFSLSTRRRAACLVGNTCTLGRVAQAHLGHSRSEGGGHECTHCRVSPQRLQEEKARGKEVASVYAGVWKEVRSVYGKRSCRCKETGSTSACWRGGRGGKRKHHNWKERQCLYLSNNKIDSSTTLERYAYRSLDLHKAQWLLPLQTCTTSHHQTARCCDPQTTARLHHSSSPNNAMQAPHQHALEHTRAPLEQHESFWSQSRTWTAARRCARRGTSPTDTRQPSARVAAAASRAGAWGPTGVSRTSQQPRREVRPVRASSLAAAQFGCEWEIICGRLSGVTQCLTHIHARAHAHTYTLAVSPRLLNLPDARGEGGVH